jgi:Na+/phosphate symporter
VKSVIENVINADIPIRGLGWLTGYLAMLLGAIMTILVQSSSGEISTLKVTVSRSYLAMLIGAIMTVLIQCSSGEISALKVTVSQGYLAILQGAS